MSAEDLKADSRSGNHPAAPECETNRHYDFPRAYLRDEMIGGENDHQILSRQRNEITRSLTLPVSGSRKRSLKESCDWLSSG